MTMYKYGDCNYQKLGHIFTGVSWRRACQLYERQPEAIKLSWEYLSVGLITEFSKNDFYEAIICELNQIKQRILEKVKYYIDWI